VFGKVRVTEATPDPFVTAITLAPLVVPLESDPALVVNSMLAPVFVPPDEPAERVTVKEFGSRVPFVPDCPSPLLAENVAAGFPMTIHPP